jgi:hypothetical protein
MDANTLIAVAIGAAGFVMWSKYQAAQAQTSVVPVAPVETAPAAQPNYLPWLAVGAIVLAFLYTAQQHKAADKKPSSTSILAGVFSTNDNADDAAKDAKAFSELCYSIATDLEVDSKLKTPFYKFAVQYDDLRRRARTYMYNGHALSEKYPKLVTAVQDHMLAKVGDAGGPVSEEQRAKWIVAFKELGAGAATEAGKL